MDPARNPRRPSHTCHIIILFRQPFCLVRDVEWAYWAGKEVVKVEQEIYETHQYNVILRQPIDLHFHILGVGTLIGVWGKREPDHRQAVRWSRRLPTVARPGS